jgi:16S rRNA (cytidine1402-2'-O)-methyltransferase
VRGVVTSVVVGSCGAPALDTDPGTLRAAVAKMESDGVRRKEAIAAVAVQAGIPNRDVYQVVHIDE